MFQQLDKAKPSMEPELRSEGGSNAENLDALLDLEEGFTRTPATNCPQ